MFLTFLAILLICLTFYGTLSFNVYWNIPTEQCHRHGVYFNLSQYGIIQNSNDLFDGDVFNIFYRGFGLFPRIINGVNINGGIPQRTNLAEHLAKVKSQVLMAIPAEASRKNGLAVIDFESWRPLWEDDFDSMSIYRKESIEYTQEMFPSLDPTSLVLKAKQQFEESARQLFESTVGVARAVRPHRRWGYYGLPHCYKYNRTDGTCPRSQQLINNRLDWLSSFGVIMPEIYFYNLEPEESRFSYVRAQVCEALRVGRLKNSTVEVLPYTQLINPDGSFYSQDDMSASLQTSRDCGAAGAIVWGSSASLSNSDQCRALFKYVHSVYGPYVASLK